MSEGVPVQTKWSELIEQEKRAYIIEILNPENTADGSIEYTKNYYDLSDTIEKFGVKKVIQWILETVEQLSQEVISFIRGDEQ